MVIRHSIIALSLTAILGAAENPRAFFALGVLAETRGDVGTAREYFEKARNLDPFALSLVQRAVDARLVEGDRSAAVKIYRDLASKRPESLAIQISYADFLTDQARGDSLAMDLAHEALTRALAKHPGHPEIIQRLFQQAQRIGDRGQQASLLNLLASDEPAAVLLYASLARTLFDPSDPSTRDRLDQRFLNAMKLHPGIHELARAASDHFRNTSRPEQAIEILKSHVATAPSSLDLRTRLGILYFTEKRDEEGKASLQEVLTIHPRHALAHQSLAKFYRLHGDVGLARFHSSELLKIRGGSPTEFINLADQWLAAENPREARLLLEKSVFEFPENRDLAHRLAIATRRDPETRAGAARLFREAEAALPESHKSDPSFLVESAEALIEEGQTKAAEERLREAIKAFPPEAKKETAAALRRLALLWESETRNPDAARALRKRADGLDD
jgi:predicted Zn-dependent protease